eukprot:bmy_17472T0
MEGLLPGERQWVRSASTSLRRLCLSLGCRPGPSTWGAVAGVCGQGGPRSRRLRLLMGFWQRCRASSQARFTGEAEPRRGAGACCRRETLQGGHQFYFLKKWVSSIPVPFRSQGLRTCYKSSKDQQPQMELPLQGCNITYIPKDSKKKKHELKITQQGTDPLVLAVQSKEQAEQWLKIQKATDVVREIYSGCSGPADSECPPPSSSPVHKAELEKKLSSERPSSDGEGVTENGIAVCNGKEQVSLHEIRFYRMIYTSRYTARVQQVLSQQEQILVKLETKPAGAGESRLPPRVRHRIAAGRWRSVGWGSGTVVSWARRSLRTAAASQALSPPTVAYQNVGSELNPFSKGSQKSFIFMQNIHEFCAYGLALQAKQNTRGWNAGCWSKSSGWGGIPFKRKKSSKSEAKGTVSKVTGKKITKIIGLGKKKPSTDEQTSSAEEDVPTCAPEGWPEAGGHRDKRVVTDSDHEPGGDTRGAAGESGGGVTYTEAPQGPPPWRSETVHAQCFLGNRVYENRATPLRRNALEAERWIFTLQEK